MKLSIHEHTYIAKRGQWYLDCATSPRRSPTAFGDSVVYTGQGLADLNRTISVVASSPGIRITCEVGTAGTILLGNAYPKYLECDIEDLYAIKQQFIEFYGSVDKPSVFRAHNESAAQVGATSVTLPVFIGGTTPVENSPYHG